MIVSWWNARGENYWAVESGPTFNHNPKGKGSSRCDAILASSMGAEVVLEVEGTRYEFTLRKIEKFFKATNEHLKKLQGGIFMTYAYKVKGSKVNRHFERIPEDYLVKLGEEIISRNPDKFLLYIIINKAFQRDADGIRCRNDYYKGNISEIYAIGVRKSGKEKRQLWPKVSQ